MSSENKFEAYLLLNASPKVCVKLRTLQHSRNKSSNKAIKRVENKVYTNISNGPGNA
jgi:hypothetical protein